MMTAKFLHGEIREKGGAYGGGARMGAGGLFSFYSYRWAEFIMLPSAFCIRYDLINAQAYDSSNRIKTRVVESHCLSSGSKGSELGADLVCVR